MQKDADAYRTISEVAETLDIPSHVLRFWETKFPQIRPLKRGGGRRYYRRADTELLRAIRRLLYDEGYTIRGVQRLLKARGPSALTGLAASDLPPPEELERGVLGSETEAPSFCGERVPQDATIMSLKAEIAACRAVLDEALRSGDFSENAASAP